MIDRCLSFPELRCSISSKTSSIFVLGMLSIVEKKLARRVSSLYVGANTVLQQIKSGPSHKHSLRVIQQLHSLSQIQGFSSKSRLHFISTNIIKGGFRMFVPKGIMAFKGDHPSHTFVDVGYLFQIRVRSLRSLFPDR
jgi:hypothetical protein